MTLLESSYDCAGARPRKTFQLFFEILTEGLALTSSVCGGAKLCGEVPNTFLNSRQKWDSLANLSSLAAALLEYPCAMRLFANRHCNSRNQWLGVQRRCWRKSRCNWRSEMEQSEAILAELKSASRATCSHCSIVRRLPFTCDQLETSCTINAALDMRRKPKELSKTEMVI